MASEDVIELGSSDDDTEPAPKKSKPKPDAMVCIPRYKFNEVTIKPTSTKLKVTGGPGKSGPSKKNDPILKTLSATEGVTIAKATPLKRLPVPQKVFSPKEIVTSKTSGILKPATPLAKKKTTVTRISNLLTNPFANKTKLNGKPLQTVISKPLYNLPKSVKIQNAPANKAAFIRHPIKIANIAPAVLNNINQATNPIKLPPSITVKRTPKPAHKPVIYMKVNKNITNTKPVVPTVELDDDESSINEPAAPGPAWYLRPEEQETSTLEEENNKEPEGPKMIEITIEDSPIKPMTNKRTCEIGTELAITIDDSPIKVVANKNGSHSGSEEESIIPKSPNSRKRLEYPKEDEESRKTLEIEIEIPTGEGLELNKKSADKDDNNDIPEVSVVTEQTESSKRDGTSKVSNDSGSREKAVEVPSTSVQGEFHPVYQNFIDVCFQLENSEDMNKIVEKKIKGYYRQVPKEYTESEEFIDMVKSKIVAMKASPEKMYLFIKDIVDELNMQRKRTKSQPQVVNLEKVPEESDQFQFGDENEFDTKRQRQIRKLEKTIKKLHRAIQKLEEHEVDFDDEDDSVYLLTERYKERMVRVYAKFCQLTNTKMPSEPRITVESRPGQPAGPAKRLEKWVNKKVPIGTPLPFPDFHDVLRCVRDANDEDKLCWNEAQIMEEARDLFTRCGKKLQRRRQENEWRLAASRLTLDVGDPAENNEQLRHQLEVNRKLASNKETEIFNKFADRQNQMKLEAEEIGDKEAEESPVESEDEDANDDDNSVSLENKGKRKERLKRLIEEISKGPSEGKENQPLEEPNTSLTEETTKGTEVKGDKEDTETLVSSKNTDKDIQNAETFSVSSENSKDLDLESDVDELHLLQKLHKGNEDTSTQESSDSDSLIAISDSLDSDNDSKELSDVISIENSSYSESEADKMNIVSSKKLDVQLNNKTDLPSNEIELVLEDTDMNPANDMTVECSKSVEDNLLASSDNESGENKKAEHNTLAVEIEIPCEDVDTPSTQVEALSPSDTCINLKDDLISIDETVVGNVAVNPEENTDNELPVIVFETENSKNKLSALEINDKEKFKDGNSRKENRGNIKADSLQVEAPGASEELQEDIVSSGPVCPDLNPPEPMDVDEPLVTETVEAHSHTGKPEVAL